MIFSQLTAFSSRERSGKALFFLWLFLCIDIKSLCLNQGFCNFWSDVFLGMARQYRLVKFSVRACNIFSTHYFFG